MTALYKLLKRYYEANVYDEDDLIKFVDVGEITQEEYDKIVMEGKI